MVSVGHESGRACDRGAPSGLHCCSLCPSEQTGHGWVGPPTEPGFVAFLLSEGPHPGRADLHRLGHPDLSFRFILPEMGFRVREQLLATLPRPLPRPVRRLPHGVCGALPTSAARGATSTTASALEHSGTHRLHPTPASVPPSGPQREAITISPLQRGN